MGLSDTSGIMVEVSKVFAFLQGVYSSFPTVVKLVTFAAFGSVVLVGVLRGVGR